MSWLVPADERSFSSAARVNDSMQWRRSGWNSGGGRMGGSKRQGRGGANVELGGVPVSTKGEVLGREK